MPNTGLSPEDIARYGLGEDSNFSEAHNRAVIASTIKKFDEVVKKKKKAFDEGMEGRSDMVYSYIRSLDKKDQPFEKYVGRHNLIKLLGEKRVQDLQRRAKSLGYKI